MPRDAVRTSPLRGTRLAHNLPTVRGRLRLLVGKQGVARWPPVNDPVDRLKDVLTRLGPTRSRVLLAAVALVLLVGVARMIWPKGVISLEPVAVPEPPTGGDFEARLPVEQNLDVAGPVQLEFDGLNGSLSIEPGAPGKLAISAFKSAR